MKSVAKGWATLFLATTCLVLTIQLVQAGRYLRVDKNHYVNITQPCRDGITFFLARDDSNTPILDWVKTEAGATLVAEQDIPLSYDPVQIPGVGEVPYSGTISWAWQNGQALQPGTRFYVRLRGDSQPIYSTVRDCTMASPGPDPVTVLVPDIGQSISSGFISAGNTVTFTLNVNMTEPIGDVNVAMWLGGDQNSLDLMTINAFLESPSPQSTRVKLMDNYTDQGRDFGSRCRLENLPLIGDLKADFNLDDESDFTYSDVGTDDWYFDYTALRPAEPLSAFDGENPNGDWRLIIENLSSIDVLLNCWFLEIAEGSFVYLPMVTLNSP